MTRFTAASDRRLEQPQRADDVDVRIGGRIVDRLAHVHLRGVMTDDVRLQLARIRSPPRRREYRAR